MTGVLSLRRYTLIIVILAASPGGAFAEEKPWPPSQEAVQDFFHGCVPDLLAARHTPGAVVVVVQGDRILFQGGYGYSDLESQQPVDPEATLFRVASISKLFAVTAALQLVEAGSLDLDQDVNTYLSAFQIPSTFPAPITLRHLMTHTAGFDDQFLEMNSPSPEAMPGLGAYLARRLPPRVMPPGRYLSYSNHGMALVGHFVEEMTDQTFSDYAEKHIFEALGMRQSHFHLVPKAETPLATGYHYWRGRYIAVPYDYPNTVPASSLAMTGADMGRFMRTQLNAGRLGEARLVQPETLAMMQQRQFGHDPALPGICLGYSERTIRGWPCIKHSGLIWGFSSQVLLVPEKNLGLFVASNSDTSKLYSPITYRFLERFLAQRKLAPLEYEGPPPGSAERIAALSGYYRHNRYCRHSFLKLGTLIPDFVSEIRVQAGKRPGTITLQYQRSGGGKRLFQEYEPYHFLPVRYVRENGEEKKGFISREGIVFGVADTGRVTHLFQSYSAYEHLQRWEAGNLLIALALGSFLLQLIHLMRALYRWWRRSAKADSPPILLERSTVLMSGMQALFVLGLLVFLFGLDPQEIGYGPPLFLKLLLVLPLVAAVISMASLGVLIYAYAKGASWCWHTLYYGVVIAASMLLLALLYYWNWLGFHFGP